MILPEILEAINQKLILDFDLISARIKHAPSKGKVREVTVVREFLNKYIPHSIGITNGEIVDSSGHHSNECDIILYDINKPILLSTDAGYKILPSEAVYGIIEVKSHLNKKELLDSCKKIYNFKSLDRSAYAQSQSPLKDALNLHMHEGKLFPYFGLIFSFSSIQVQKLRMYLDDFHKQQENKYMVDSIFCLDKGGILNKNLDTNKIEMINSKQCVHKAVRSKNIILFLTMHLLSVLQNAYLPKIWIWKYIGDSFVAEIET